MDEHGVWQEDDEVMEWIIIDSFSTIFQTAGPTGTIALTEAICKVVITTIFYIGLIS